MSHGRDLVIPRDNSCSYYKRAGLARSGDEPVKLRSDAPLVHHATEHATLTADVEIAGRGERRWRNRKDAGEGLNHRSRHGRDSSVDLAQLISIWRVVQPTRQEPILRLITPRPRTTHDSVRAPVVPRVRV